MELEASGDTCKHKKHVESHGELKKLYRETMETGEDSNKHRAEIRLYKDIIWHNYKLYPQMFHCISLVAYNNIVVRVHM